MLKSLIFGAILLNAWAVSVFFYRFWKKTRDRLFAFFAIAFLILGAERIVMVSISEGQPLVYLMRLSAFLLLLYAILDKNRAGRSQPPQNTPKSQREAVERF